MTSGISSVDRRSSEDILSQVSKSYWWMPRHQQAMKDVQTCEKPRGAGKMR
jgi:hypothetical protein